MDKRPALLGIPIDDLPIQEIGQLFHRWLGDTGQHYLVTPNPEMLVVSTRDDRLRQALVKADLAISDGVGVQLASWWCRNPIRHRIAGVDVAWELLRQTVRSRASVYFLGGQPGVAQMAAERLTRRLPGLHIAGATDGGRVDKPEEFSDRIVDTIRQAKPKVLIVALGHGTQERLIAGCLHRLPSVRIAIGVGGAFDYWSGKIRRAPLFLRYAGLEWLYRLVRQPVRLPRILRAVLVFPYLLLTTRHVYRNN